MDPTLTEQPGVVGVDLGGVQVLQLHRSELRHEVLFHQHAVAGERGLPHAALDRRQPDLEQELAQAKAAGQDVGVFGQGGELAGEGRLAVLAASKATLGLAPALLGLTEFATTCGTRRLRPALYPESPSAALAALGAIAADIEDVLPRSCRCALANVALRVDLPASTQLRSEQGAQQRRWAHQKHGEEGHGTPLRCGAPSSPQAHLSLASISEGDGTLYMKFFAGSP